MQGYYINLEDRIDREHYMQSLIHTHPFFQGIRRWNATRHENGAIGCGLSHRAALEQLDREVENQDDLCILLEDDFCILHEGHFHRFMSDFEVIRNEPSWDVIVLTPRGDLYPVSDDKMSIHHFRRIHNHQTCTGMIVRKRFLPILIGSHTRALQRMQEGVPLDDCAIDQQWKSLQDHYLFYYYQHIYAGQLPGYSSIEKRIVDYNQRFIDQK